MRAQMNSPWDPISADSSRRSSLAGHENSAAQQANPISHHLTRLHRKAQTIQQQQQQQQQQQTPSATPTPQQNGMSSHDMSRMHTMQQQLQQHPQMMPQHHQQQQQQQQVRRASDPVRTLDRNFGVGGGQLSRHQRSGSYNQLNNLGCNQMQQRVPLHGQRIRGLSSAGAETEQNYFQQNQVRTFFSNQ